MESHDRLVVAQAVSIAGLAWPGPARWTLAPAGVVGAAAACLAGAALAGAGAAAQGRLLTPRVEPPEGAVLLTRGVYRVSRNPIYAGLLVGGAGFAVLRRRAEPLVAWAALAVVLVRKCRAEEDRLGARFGAAYERYRAATPMFLGRPAPAPDDVGVPPAGR